MKSPTPAGWRMAVARQAAQALIRYTTPTRPAEPAKDITMTTNDPDVKSLYQIGKTEHEWRQILEADRDRAKARVEDLEGRICDILSANPYARLTAFQGRLADAVGLLDRVVTQVVRTITSELREEIDAFLASHAQLAAMTTEQSLAISQRTRDAYVAKAEHLKAQPAAAEPIQVEAVAVTREDEDGLYLDWVLEGGISALEAPGVVLLVAHGKVTDDQGSGEVYLAQPTAGEPVATRLVLPTPEQVMHIVMRFQWEDRKNGTGTTNWAANLGMAVVGYVARLNSLPHAAAHSDEVVLLDAKRYRWLRNGRNYPHGFISDLGMNCESRFDEKVDVAMRAQGDEGGNS